MILNIIYKGESEDTDGDSCSQLSGYHEVCHNLPS